MVFPASDNASAFSLGFSHRLRIASFVIFNSLVQFSLKVKSVSVSFYFIFLGRIIFLFRLRNVLFPTLIAACFQNEENKKIIEQEVSCALLENYIEVCHIRQPRVCCLGATVAAAKTSENVAFSQVNCLPYC